MTKKFLFSAMIASLLAFVGCQNEELVNENTNNGGEKVILTANIQGSAQTRLALTAGTNSNDKPIVKIAWREYDENNPETFFVAGANGESWFTQVSDTEFSGTLPEPYDGSYVALYNLNLFNNFGNHKHFTFEQDGTLREQDMMMIASFNEDATSIEFQHQMSILKPTFKVGEDIINNTITHIEMGEIFCCTTTVVIDVEPTAPATTLKNDIYLTIPILEEISEGRNQYNFMPGETFNFAVTADGKDYTGSLTIPQIADWNPEGKLFTATIELTEVLSAKYIWKSDITASASVEGEGTEASPYLIHSANDLQWMINQVNSAAPQPSPIDESENSTPQLPYYRLTHNLEIDSEEGATWTPIGTSSSPFVGYFDGGGYTISGEMVTASDVVDAGFFGYVGVGTVITNLTNAANITPLVQGACQVGGIVGFAKGYDKESCQYNSTYIIACHNTGTITYTNSETSEDLIFLGGIAGYIHGGTCVLACSNTGDMVHNSSEYIIHGGIVGVGDTEINTDPSVVSCQTSKGTIIGEIYSDRIRANYTTDVNYESDPYYISAYTEELVWDFDFVYNGLNFYIYQFNSWNYDYTYRKISCNWHWELENGSVVLKPGAPE